jgi:hypothetical protein
MSMAAKSAAIFVAGAIAVSGLAGCDWLKPKPKVEAACNKYPLEQAESDRRALGGGADAMAKRAACSWPLDANDQPVLKDPNEERVIEGFFWTALNYCRSTIERDAKEEDRKRAIAARQRFDSVRAALSRFDEGAKNEAQSRYQERLASLGAQGIVELARNPDCPFDVNIVTRVGVLQAAKESWADLPGVPPGRKDPPPGQNPPGEAKPWPRVDGDRKKNWDPDTELRKFPLSDPAQIKQAGQIKDAFLAGLAGSTGALRAKAAIADMDRYDVLDLHWLLYDLNEFTGFELDGDLSDKVYALDTIKAIRALENAAKDGRLCPKPGDGEECDPPIRGDLSDGRLTNEETRNLVCWAAAYGEPRATRLTVLGHLAWMYAYGFGYPKDLPKARAIIGNVLSQVGTLQSVLSRDPVTKDVIKKFYQNWLEISEYILGQVGARGQSRPDYRQFELTQAYLCPGKFNVEESAEDANAGAAAAPPLSVSSAPALGMAPSGDKGTSAVPAEAAQNPPAPKCDGTGKAIGPCREESQAP